MKVFLIGMPGSGKSTLGKELAQKLAVTFIDLDAEIERNEGQPIKTLFEIQGEPYFRQAEAAVLREVTAANQSFVMATGGGAPCFYEGIEFMNSVGLTVFLDIPVDELYHRLNGKESLQRPLLQVGSNLTDTLYQLRSSRLKFYEQATYRLTNPDVIKLVTLVQPKT
jgi:shikimate kinase